MRYTHLLIERNGHGYAACTPDVRVTSYLPLALTRDRARVTCGGCRAKWTPAAPPPDDDTAARPVIGARVQIRPGYGYNLYDPIAFSRAPLVFTVTGYGRGRELWGRRDDRRQVQTKIEHVILVTP